MKVLVSTISFINHNKAAAGSEIYATYTNRLIEYTMKNTPFDIRVATNRPELFQQTVEKYPDRVSLWVDTLGDNKVQVGSGFNQLLKYLALTNIPTDYDYVLYLDGDTSFYEPINEQEFEQTVTRVMQQHNCNALFGRNNSEYMMQCLSQHENYWTELQRRKENNEPTNDLGSPGIFSQKFRFYKITSDNIPETWRTAPMPYEHILFFKNEEGRLQKMSDVIKEFNQRIVAQDGVPDCNADMEAFELGVGATEAGFVAGPLSSNMERDTFKIKYNGSNWEKIKL